MSKRQKEAFCYADLTLPQSPGVLALMSCPGARGAGAREAGPDDDLSRDLSKICANGVRMVVSCLELRELPFEAERYRRWYRRKGIQWEHLPIPDYQPPPERLEKVMARLFETVDLRLQLGEKVGFHCYGGLGRTGTVVARYLIHKGLMPEDAIRYLRRNYDAQAIESAAQETYLHSFAAVRASSS